jgi:hypothetical protein
MVVLMSVLVLPAIRLAGPGMGGIAGGSPSASPTAAIVWDSGEVRLTASAIRIVTPEGVFTAQVPDLFVGGDPGSATYRTLEIEWWEADREQRLYIYLAADRAEWWVTEIRTRDGEPNAEWVTYVQPTSWRMPIGATYVGQLRLSQGPYALEIDDMALQAFHPATIPAQLRFCRPAEVPGGGGDPLAPGQPLAGSGIESMTPTAAQTLLRLRGFCHMFRYSYDYTDAPGSGYGEAWCDPPPGVITELAYGGDGEVLIFVEDAMPTFHSPRPQPPVGWGC